MLYLSLGSNSGDRRSNLETAVQRIGSDIGPVLLRSNIIETEPWGFTSGNMFLNMAVAVETGLSPVQILDITQQIERDLGRVRKSIGGIYSDRPIDIDILLCGDAVIHTERLTVPHPLMTGRKFVMEPLAQIAPDTVHPVLGLTIRQLATELQKKNG